MDKENKKSRLFKAKSGANKKKKRRPWDFFELRRQRKRKDNDKLTFSGENIIPYLSGQSGVVNDAFVLDTVQVAGNRLHTSLASVAAAVNNDNGNSSTSDEDECMPVASAAISDETQNETPGHLDRPCIQCFHSQHKILELSNEVAQLSEETKRTTISAMNLLHECRELAKEKQLLIEQHQWEIQQITLTNRSKIGKLEEGFGKQVSSLKEVNDSLMNKVVWTEDEKFMLKEEQQELLTQRSDLKSENSQLHQNMTILMQKFGKVKRGLSQKNDKYNVSIANAEHVSFVY